jgi:hypothetical protein
MPDSSGKSHIDERDEHNLSVNSTLFAPHISKKSLSSKNLNEHL